MAIPAGRTLLVVVSSGNFCVGSTEHPCIFKSLLIVIHSVVFGSTDKSRSHHPNYNSKETGHLSVQVLCNR